MNCTNHLNYTSLSLSLSLSLCGVCVCVCVCVCLCVCVLTHARALCTNASVTKQLVMIHLDMSLHALQFHHSDRRAPVKKKKKH